MPLDFTLLDIPRTLTLRKVGFYRSCSEPGSVEKSKTEKNPCAITIELCNVLVKVAGDGGGVMCVCVMESGSTGGRS